MFDQQYPVTAKSRGWIFSTQTVWSLVPSSSNFALNTLMVLTKGDGVKWRSSVVGLIKDKRGNAFGARFNYLKYVKLKQAFYHLQLLP